MDPICRLVERPLGLRGLLLGKGHSGEVMCMTFRLLVLRTRFLRNCLFLMVIQWHSWGLAYGQYKVGLLSAGHMWELFRLLLQQLLLTS